MTDATLPPIAGRPRLGGSLAPVAAVLLSAGVLIAGNGLLTLLVPLRGQAIALDPLVLGLLGSAYFFGYVSLGVLGPALIARVGHIRGFAVAAAILSTSSLLLVISEHPALWIAARAVFGGAMATLYLVMESWLNERSDHSTRGSVFGVYMIVNFGALGAGQLAVSLIDIGDLTPFIVASMLLTLSLLPVCLTRATHPAPLQTVTLRIAPIWRNSPVSVIGCLLAGAAHGAFWTIGPIFVGALGFSLTQTAQFMAISVLGGAIAQYPIGWLSDKIDRRIVLCLTALAAIVFGVLLVMAPQLGLSTGIFLTVAICFGGCLLPMYSLIIAHANDHAELDDFVNTSMVLLLLFGTGAMIGPTIAAKALETFGPAGFVGHIVIALGLLVLYALYRIIRRAPPADKEPFVVAARTSPQVYELDPRGEEDGQEPGEMEAQDAESAKPLAPGADPGASQSEEIPETLERTAMSSDPGTLSIAASDGSGSFGGYLSLPSSGTGPGLIVIQEIFGVNSVMRQITDDFASQGFVAFCPDIFWRLQPDIQITDQSEEEWQQAFDYFQRFDQDKGIEDLQAAVTALRADERTGSKVGAVGFCLGGRLAARMALDTDVNASVGYYGVGLEDFAERADDVRAPLMLHIAEEDGFVPKDAQETVKQTLGRSPKVTIHSYPGKDHAFARKGGAHYDAAAASLALDRTMVHFKTTIFGA